MIERPEAADPGTGPGKPDQVTPRAAPLDNRIALEPKSAERGLATLVLTVVELLRQLIERQALRRVDVGDLSDDQVERIGETLLGLEEQMTELCRHFGIEQRDLNIDLGPLGPLLPRE